MRTAISLFCWWVTVFRTEEIVSANQTLGPAGGISQRACQVSAVRRRWMQCEHRRRISQPVRAQRTDGYDSTGTDAGRSVGSGQDVPALHGRGRTPNSVWLIRIQGVCQAVAADGARGTDLLRMHLPLTASPPPLMIRWIEDVRRQSATERRRLPRQLPRRLCYGHVSDAGGLVHAYDGLPCYRQLFCGSDSR
jgi:hypothetical protein